MSAPSNVGHKLSNKDVIAATKGVFCFSLFLFETAVPVGERWFARNEWSPE
jgi:hypothetical protein